MAMIKRDRTEIVDGHPVEFYREGDGNSSRFSELPEDYQLICSEWLRDHVIERKTVNLKFSSYGLKHKLEADTGIYMNNNQFKDFLLLNGFQPIDSHALNWYFRIMDVVTDKAERQYREDHNGKHTKTWRAIHREVK